MTGQPFHIRIAREDDMVGLARLNASFNQSTDTGDQLAARMADPRRVETPIVAEVDGQLVGFTALRVVPCVFYSTPHAELTELFVEAAYRRRGIGRALIAYAVELAQQAGADEMTVLTGFDNHEAQALYRAMGFEADDLEMNKPL